MPPAAKRGCRAPMCAGLTSERHGYCTQHEKLASGWNDPSRGTREQRGYDSRWRRVRSNILKRDGYRCRCDDCKRLGRVLPAGEVDHRIPKFEGGSDDPSNLYAINRDCHKRKTQAEALRARTVQ